MLKKITYKDKDKSSQELSCRILTCDDMNEIKDVVNAAVETTNNITELSSSYALTSDIMSKYNPSGTGTFTIDNIDAKSGQISAAKFYSTTLNRYIDETYTSGEIDDKFETMSSTILTSCLSTGILALSEDLKTVSGKVTSHEGILSGLSTLLSSTDSLVRTSDIYSKAEISGMSATLSSAIPLSTSQLVNDSNYATLENLEEFILASKHLTYEVITGNNPLPPLSSSLPDDPVAANKNTLYFKQELISSQSESEPVTANIYNEYLIINNKYEQIGGVSTYLNNYYTKADSDNRYIAKEAGLTSNFLSSNNPYGTGQLTIDSISAKEEISGFRFWSTKSNSYIGELIDEKDPVFAAQSGKFALKDNTYTKDETNDKFVTITGQFKGDFLSAINPNGTGKLTIDSINAKTTISGNRFWSTKLSAYVGEITEEKDPIFAAQSSQFALTANTYTIQDTNDKFSTINDMEEYVTNNCLPKNDPVGTGELRIDSINTDSITLHDIETNSLLMITDKKIQGISSPSYKSYLGYDSSKGGYIWVESQLEPVITESPLKLQAGGTSGIFQICQAGNNPYPIELLSSENCTVWAPCPLNTDIQLYADRSIYFKNKNTLFSKDSENYYYFKNNKDSNLLVSLKGNCNSLINYSNNLSIYTFFNLFKGFNIITRAEELLLPADTLSESCYESMFQGCTNLIYTPTLSATTLHDSCYKNMFNGCSKLVAAPTLPAGTLAPNCYYSMFQGCTSLTKAPNLPGFPLVSNCYYNMFNGCSNLNTITVGFTSWRSDLNATTNWVAGVASQGTFNCQTALTQEYGPSNIPNGWTPKVKS